MCKLKNNKGLTGIDIVISLSIIIVTVVLVVSMYSSYNSKSKEVKRNTTANNLAIRTIQELKQKDYKSLAELFEENEEINIEDVELFSNIIVDEGYEIFIKKINSEENYNNIEILVSVNYKIGKNDKSIQLSTIKQMDIVEKIELPDKSMLEDGITVSEGEPEAHNYDLFYLKYDINKKGYVKVQEEKNWYSYDAKKYAIAVYANEEDFDINDVILLEDCYEIYLWIPSYAEIDEKYVYCISKNDIYYPIEYKLENGIVNYTLSEESVEKIEGSGNWIKVDNKLEPDVENNSEEIINAFEILKLKEFQY